MSESIILSTPAILILSLVSAFAFVIARLISHKTVASVLCVGAFLVVAGCVTYALLLGAGIDEVLVYILVYAALAMLEFLRPTDKSAARKPESLTEKITEREQREISELAPTADENPAADGGKGEVDNEL